MATVSQNVVVRISVQNGGNVQSTLNQIGTQGQAAFGGLSTSIERSVISMGKMFATIAAWKILVTIPREIAEAFGNLVISMIKSADEVERSIIGTAALITTFTDFGKSMSENFGIGILQARKLQIEFVKLSGTGLASASDIAKGFEALTARGGLSMVKDFKEAAGASALLVNTILAITQGQAKEKQIMSEINGILTSQNLAGNILTKIIEAQVGNLKQWTSERVKHKDLEAELQRLLRGFVEQADEASQTLGGMTDQIMGMLEALNAIVMKSGALDTLKNLFGEIRADLRQVFTDLSSGETETRLMAASTQNLLLAFGIISQIITDTVQTVILLAKTLLGISDETGPMQAVKTALIRILTLFVFVKMTVDDIIKLFGFLAPAFSPFFSLLKAFYQVRLADKVQKEMESIGKTMEGVIKYFTDLNGVSDDLGKPNPFSGGDTDDVLKKQAQILKNAREMIAEFRQAADSTGPLNATVELLQKAADKLDDIRAVVFDLNSSAERNALLRAAELAETIMIQNGMIAIHQKEQEYWDKERAAFEGAMNASKEVIIDAHINKDIIDQVNSSLDAQIARYKIISELAQITMDANRAAFKEMDRLGGRLSLGDRISAMQEVMRYTREQIAIQEQKRLELEARLASYNGVDSPGAARVQNELQNTIRGIETLNDQLDESLIRMMRIGSIQDPFQSIGDGAQRAIIALIALHKAMDKVAHDTALREFKLAVAEIFGGIVEYLGEAMASLLTGFGSFKSIFKHIIGEIIVSIGTLIVQMGIAIMAQGFLFSNPAKVAKGIAITALGGVVIGLGKAMAASSGPSDKGGGGSGGGGSSADAGSRTVFLSLPAGGNTPNVMASVNTSISRLNNTLDRMDTLSPGAVVMAGSKETGVGDTILSVTASALKTNQRERSSVVGTIRREM